MRRIYGAFCRGETIVAASCFVASCLMIFVAAIARSVRQPINWAQDMSLFLFAWSVLLSADVALRHDKLVRVEFIYEKFPERVRNVVTAINYVIILIFLAALVYFGLRLSYTTRVRVFQGIPGFSYTWVTLSVPVGALFQMITIILKLKVRLGESVRQ